MTRQPLRKVLIVFQQRPPIADYLEREFNQRGIEVVKFYSDQNTWFDRWIINRLNKQLHNLRILPKQKNLFVNHPWAHRNYLNQKLWDIYQQTKPDLCLAIRGMDIGLDAIERMDCSKIAWWVEPETHIHEAIAEAQAFDWYFCMNQACVDAMKNASYPNTSYLPHAVSTQDFFPIDGVLKRYDLCFVGKHSEKRQKFIEAALQVTNNIVIYGPRWRERNLDNPKIRKLCLGQYISGSALNQLYNESKVVLNVTGWNGVSGSPPSGLNMRILEVPATGTCLLTDGIRELSGVFKVGSQILVYEDEHELIDQLDWALRHEEEREAVAKAGCNAVQNGHTYKTTLSQIIEIADSLPHASN